MYTTKFTIFFTTYFIVYFFKIVTNIAILSLESFPPEIPITFVHRNSNLIARPWQLIK